MLGNLLDDDKPLLKKRVKLVNQPDQKNGGQGLFVALGWFGCIPKLESNLGMLKTIFFGG